MAQKGLKVVILEAKNTIGGGMRSAELTLPGFVHDICSAIHPLGLGSPFFQTLPLEKYGLEWIHPDIPLAHPFDDGKVVLLERSVEKTAQALGADRKTYKNLIGAFAKDWDKLSQDILGPFHFPKHPLLMAHFAYYAIRSAEGLIQSRFREKEAKALFAGLSAHSIMSLDKWITASFGMVLGILGHAVGWPLPKGGSQKIADALGRYLESLGGKIVTGVNVESLDALPSAKVILCDITPKQLLQIAGDRLPQNYRKELEAYRYGPGVFKIDWALSCPVPWKSRECLRAGTVHVGGDAEEIFVSEKTVWNGQLSKKPFILLAQQSLFDTTRAPPGKQTLWGYCHVPNGSTADMTQIIEEQIERFAPGFQDCILARSTRTAMDLQFYNANNIGGDINGGVQDIKQLFTRPVARIVPYSTPVKGLYFCSSSTPPGGGVHGMCGYHAAHASLKECF